MTRQTISICNARGGIALDGDEAEALAELIEWMSSQASDSEINMRARSRLRRVIRVLRGEAPAELGELA